MLVGVRLTVNTSLEKTCFAYISSKYCTSAQESQCIQLLIRDAGTHDPKYLWAVFVSSVPEGSILINPLNCKLLSLRIGAEVTVNTYAQRNLESLFIEADGNEDHVILEHNQQQLQRVFLDQVRLVVQNQPAVVWLSASLPIIFTPKQTGVLVNNIQVTVNTVIHETRTNPKHEEIKRTYNAMQGLLRPLCQAPKKIALRALPIENDGKKDLIHPYTVYIHEDLIEEKFRCSPFIIACMKNVPFIDPSNDDDRYQSICHELCVEVVPIDSVVFRSLCREVYSQYIPTVLIPKSLNRIINIENGIMVMLTFVENNALQQPNHIKITTYSTPKESAHSLIEKFKTLVIQNTYSGKMFLINHDMVKQNQQLTSGFIKFSLSPHGIAYTTIIQETFRHCSITAQCLDLTEMTPQISNVSMDYDYKSYCRAIIPLEVLLERILSHIYFDIHREARFNKGCTDLKGNILITGVSGSGKSTLCNIVQKEISVHSHIVYCRPLKGRKDIHNAIAKALRVCMNRKPALLVLDDIDALLPSSMEGLSPQDIATYNTLAVDIKLLLTDPSGVSILMTARSVNDLHPILRLFTGMPMFTAHFNMPGLAQADRVQLFQHLVNHKIREHFEVDVDDVIRLAMDTSGCTIRDVTDYYNKKIFAAIKKRNANPDGPKPRIVEDVTKDMEKLKACEVWGPIGGMHDVKQKLNECIFWPILYPALFPSRGCGILLYGMPGTGKSLIGSCLAKMPNMNMIIVKGPELLSKFIGQSEAAVREVFDKADQNRPCILFFDEFDSLAPKRGHDSTGVTDRVVNQMLARLDGAEGGASCPVIAATSRPDLIDPALLRTGRISTHIYCELPDVDGRHEILSKLSEDFNLKDDVQLRQVAELTDGFSGADLRALLVTAQLTRLDMELFGTRVTEDENEPAIENVVIEHEDILNALTDTKPSLSVQYRRYYDVMYRRFRGEELPEADRPTLAYTLRSTLA